MPALRHTEPSPDQPGDKGGHGDDLGRALAEQMFSRTAGAALVEGNAVRLLRDAAQNYEAWLHEINHAQRCVHFENYIFRADPISRRFADALAARARAGVQVRVLLDWMGSYRSVSRAICRQLREAGAELRFFNPPRLDSPLGWMSRNHRKSITIDGKIGFVAGLCVGQMWVGDPARKVAPWRDTGIEVRGPALRDLDHAFSQSWAQAGPRLQDGCVPDHDDAPAGSVALRVIGSKPNRMGLYRFDQVLASLARDRLWLTDAYFVGTTAYVRALCDAARDGVDVRLLVPGASDIPVAKALSRAGYRPLLQAGIRVFEWNGPMLHAKAAVVDGRWARIGSSNLNLASWIGNWELDVAIEDTGFAEQVEAMFQDDLQNATEIVLQKNRSGGRVRRASHPDDGATQRGRRRGSPGRLAAGAVGIGSAVSAAITNHRTLGAAEARVMGAAGALLLAIAVVALLWPLVLTIPLAILAAWLSAALLTRAWRLHRRGRRARRNGADSAGPQQERAA